MSALFLLTHLTPNQMENLQQSLNEGVMAIMINDAIASINYFNFYKTIEDYGNLQEIT